MKQKVFTLLTLALLVCSGAWAATETLDKSSSDKTAFVGTSFTTSANMMTNSKSGDYVKVRTNMDNPQWTFNVNSGYKITGIRVVGYSNNSYSGATIIMSSMSIDGGSNILTGSDPTEFPTGNGNAINLEKSGFDARTSITCTFDNSNIITDTENPNYSKGKNSQLMVKITITYEEIAGVTIAPTITQSGATITLASATADADIYYTLDGTTPTSSSTSYSDPFDLINPCTVRAIAIKEDVASTVTDKDCYFTPTGALALLKFTSGAINGGDAYLWNSTDGDYALRDKDNVQTTKYTSLEAGNDAFKLSHVDGYTLYPSSDIKITKIAFIGKSLYEGYTGTVTVENFNSNAASSFITYPAEGQKYLSTIEFTPDDELSYGSVVNFNPGGCESAAYIVIYGVKRSGPATPESGTGLPITWDFTGYDSKVAFTSGSSYSYTADDASTEMRYTAGSSDEITANSYLKENGASGGVSGKDIDGTTPIGKTRLIRLFVSGKGTLRINCTSNIGAYTIYEGNATNTASSGSALITGYAANTTSSTLNVTNGLWIETTTKGYITTIVWTPASDDVVLTTTDNMDGWRAFNPDGQGYTLDANTTAYIVTADKSENKIALTSLAAPGEDIPGNTCVLLHTTSSADSHKMTLKKKTVADYSGTPNKLQASTGALVNVYRLGFGGDGVAFYPYNGTPEAGTVYLNISSSEAHALTIDFGNGDVTAINKVEAAKQNASEYYNLAGQRVAQPTKGLYIVNGKKVVLK